MKETYEKVYEDKNSFSFGKNWQNFLKNLNDEKVEEAKNSLVKFLGGVENIEGKTFVDIGCGSGIFSLAAYKLGAKKVVSIDVDKFSIACATYLYKKENNPKEWEIKKGSALDLSFIKSLGTFDIVYSWGVLHHTGNMYKAFNNIVNLIDKQGVFYLAIYNKNTRHKLEGTSLFWLKEKKIYNSSSRIIKRTIETIYITYYIMGLLISFKNPIKYVKNYTSFRGMNFWTDIKDWLGGYPYEFAGVERIVRYFEGYNLKNQKYNEARSIGCNEFLFKKDE